MKILSTLALGAAVLLMSGGAFAMGRTTGSSTTIHRSSAACNAFTNAVPVWQYSRAAGRMVFAGYECVPVPGGR